MISDGCLVDLQLLLDREVEVDVTNDLFCARKSSVARERTIGASREFSLPKRQYDTVRRMYVELVIIGIWVPDDIKVRQMCLK